MVAPEPLEQMEPAALEETVVPVVLDMVAVPEAVAATAQVSPSSPSA